MQAIDCYIPLQNYILCEPVEEGDKIGRFYLPETARVPLTQGIVMKIGPHVDPDQIAPGDLIIFNLHTESRIQLDRKTYLVVADNHVLVRAPKAKLDAMREGQIASN